MPFILPVIFHQTDSAFPFLSYECKVFDGSCLHCIAHVIIRLSENGVRLEDFRKITAHFELVSFMSGRLENFSLNIAVVKVCNFSVNTK